MNKSIDKRDFFMKLLKTLIFSAICLLSSACVQLMDATNNEPISTDPGKRSFGTYMDDERLETVIKVNLRKANPELAEAHVNVTAFNGVILLSGEVPSEELRLDAGRTVQEMREVNSIHNRLLIKANSTVFSRSNDTWLSTKVRAKLISSDFIESERIKVVVENRIVYLLGLVTPKEAKKVSEMVATVGGVEQVVRVFEYIEQ